MKCRYKNDQQQCIAGCPVKIGEKCEDVGNDLFQTCDRYRIQHETEYHAAKAGFAYNFIKNQWERITHETKVTKSEQGTGHG
jgi:hypothetical protein